jgi:hypothetical protein
MLGAPKVAHALGLSAMSASVVSIRPATLAAFCSAWRTTFAGSMTPNSSRSLVLFGRRVVAEGTLVLVADLLHDDAAFDARVLGDLAQRLLDARRTMIARRSLLLVGS